MAKTEKGLGNAVLVVYFQT